MIKTAISKIRIEVGKDMPVEIGIKSQVGPHKVEVPLKFETPATDAFLQKMLNLRPVVLTFYGVIGVWRPEDVTPYQVNFKPDAEDPNDFSCSISFKAQPGSCPSNTTPTITNITPSLQKSTEITVGKKKFTVHDFLVELRAAADIYIANNSPVVFEEKETAPLFREEKEEVDLLTDETPKEEAKKKTRKRTPKK